MAQSDKFNFAISCYHIEQYEDVHRIPAPSWVIEEGNQRLTYQDVNQGHLSDARIININEEGEFEMKSHNPYWFTINISSDIVLNDHVLLIDQKSNGWPFEPSFYRIESYLEDLDTDELEHGYSGTIYPSSKRDVKNILVPSAILVNSFDNSNKRLWVKMVNAQSVKLSLELSIMPMSRFVAESGSGKSFGNFILIGACITLMVIGVLLFMWTMDKIYIWFILLLIGVLLQGIHIFHNDVFAHFLGEYPRVIVFMLIFNGLFLFLSILQFAKIYINTKEVAPVIHRILGYAMIALLLGASIGTFLRFTPTITGEWWFKIRIVFIGGTFLTVIICMSQLMFSKDILARFFSIGTTLPVTALLFAIYQMHSTRNLRYEHLYVMVNLGYVMALTSALAYRLNLVIKQKELAKQEKINAELEFSKQQIRLDLANNFFSNITHELRTPLTLILEPVRQILSNSSSKPFAHKLQLIKNNSEKLLGLVNQLLDVSKLESGKMSIDLKRGDLLEVIMPIYRSFLLLAESKGLELKFHHDKKIPEFNFDVFKLEKIVHNLLSNALKFTDTGRVILDVSIAKSEDSKSHSESQNLLQLTVSDTGRGIASKDLQYIFDRFHQVETSKKDPVSGSGIGLALVKELVDLLGGTIHAESTLHNGSTFKVLLPLERAYSSKEGKLLSNVNKKMKSDFFQKENDNELRQNSEINQHELYSKRSITKEKPSSEYEEMGTILIVEDNTELRTFIRESLNFKYNVIEATNGSEGIHRALELIPDVIVSDIMMPQKDGYQLTRNLKNNELTSHIPIILLTAKSALQSKIEGLESGADAYIPKPFNTEELLVRIEKLIEIRKRLHIKYSRLGHHTTDSEEINHSEIDNEFLRKIKILIMNNLSDTSFSVEALSSQMFLSRSQLFRKLKALTGQTVVEYIRNIKLDRAMEFLRNKEGNVTEVAEMVGFSDDRYFSLKFRERFNVVPSSV